MHWISAHGWQACVADMGAELQSLRDRQGNELLWQGDPAWWSGRSPILFPIVGRAPDDRLRIDGQACAMAQHGIARRQKFELLASGPDFTRHQLVENEATLASYPRRFRLVIEHRLTETGLSILVEVHNTDDRPLPFGLGFHPAFRWPLPGAEGQDHLVRLGNGAEPRPSPLEGGLIGRDLQPSPFRDGQLTLDPAMFAADALVFLGQDSGTTLHYGPRQGPGLGFRFENLPFLALWTKPGAPFLCIEPWHGAAAWADGGDAIEDRPGTMILAPGDARRFALHVAPDQTPDTSSRS